MSFLDFSKPYKSPICAHGHHYIIWLLECMDVEGNSIIGALDCIHISNLFVIEVLDDLVSWDMLGPVASFLDENSTKQSLLLQLNNRFQHRIRCREQTLYPCPKQLSSAVATIQQSSQGCHILSLQILRMIFSFTKIKQPNDVTLHTASIMVLIAEWPWLPWNKHKPGTGILIHPFGH